MLASVELQVDDRPPIEMRIVHVETGRHLYGGAQQVLYLLRGLTRRGIDCVLVCPPDSAISGAAAASGLTTREIACRGDADLAFGVRLRRLLRGGGPDLVHAHSRRAADTMSARAAGSVPAVLTRRVDTVEPPWLARFRTAGYRRVIAISEHVARRLEASGVERGRITVIRSAVDVDAFPVTPDRDRWRREFDLSDTDVSVVMVAQFIGRKGHRYAIEALAGMVESCPGVRLLLFGQGPLQSSLRSDVARAGLGDHVRFAGFRPDLDSLLGNADVLLHPATDEGLGVAMLKAAAAGVPVVAFDVAGAKEAVVNNETGLLVPAGDVPALLRALMTLVENPELRRQLGERGRSRMRQEFTTEHMVDQHVRLYESLLRERH